MNVRRYERGIKVRDNKMGSIDIARDAFHGEWNYVIRPRLQLDLTG
jgi:hypothetical protein